MEKNTNLITFAAAARLIGKSRSAVSVWYLAGKIPAEMLQETPSGKKSIRKDKFLARYGDVENVEFVEDVETEPATG